MPNVRKPGASAERPFTRSIYAVKGEVREFVSDFANLEDAPAYDICSIQTEILHWLFPSRFGSAAGMFAAETYAGSCRSASVAEKSPRPCHHGYDHPEKRRLTAPDVRPYLDPQPKKLTDNKIAAGKA